MEVSCDKCGSSTSPKEITSKKTGKNYTVYECNGGCMNGKFRYSRFAPSDNYGGYGSSQSSASSGSSSSGGGGNVSGQLRAIDAKLTLILKLLQNKSGAANSDGGNPPYEPEPEQEIPF